MSGCLPCWALKFSISWYQEVPLRCGSSVFARSGDEIELHLGALDEPDQFVPTYEAWTCRRENWLPPFPGLRGYQRDRDTGDD